MYRAFQNYFKENNIKIFLKYDGERTREIFTVMIINKDNPNNTVSKDTDKPFEIFQVFIDELNIIASGEDNKLLFDTFIKMKKELNAIIKSDSVFIFTIEMKEKLEFYISIQSREVNTSYRSTDLQEVLEFCKNIK